MTRRGHRRIIHRQRSQRRLFVIASDDGAAAVDPPADPVKDIETPPAPAKLAA